MLTNGIRRADHDCGERGMLQGRPHFLGRPRTLDAVECESGYRDLAAPTDEIFLKSERTLRRMHDGTHGRIAHRQDVRLDSETPAQIRGDRREPFAAAKPLAAQHMGRQIAIADAEPRRSAEPRRLVEKVPGFSGNAPAGLRVGDAGKRIHDGVEVGRDGEAEMLEIVAGVDHYTEIAA